MFLSIKRKFSNAILNTVILITFVFCCYLAKQVGTVEINRNISQFISRLLNSICFTRKPHDYRATLMTSTNF